MHLPPVRSIRSTLFTLPLLLLFTACATKPTPSSIIPAAPPKAIPVTPEASKLRDQINAADKTAALIDTGAKEAHKAATAARAQAERLKDQKSATPAELTKLWQDLQSLEARNLFLETETSRLTANLTDARNTAGTLQQYAAAKDAEAQQLRSQHSHLSTMVSDYSTQLTTANKATTQQRARADRLAGEILLYRIALGIIAALLIGWAILKLFLPNPILSLRSIQ